MKKDIRLIAVDLDGTLLDSAHRLSERNRRALQQAIEGGVQVVIATGKTRFSARGLIRELGIASPGVYLQGTTTYHADGRVRRSVAMDRDTLRQVIAFAKAHGMDLLAYSGDRVFARRADDATADRLAEYGEPMPEAVGAMENILHQTGDINKLILYGAESRIAPMRKRLSRQLGEQVHLTRANVRGVLEVLPANASKGAGVALVMKDLGIAPENALAIGDGENDIEMLKTVGLGVAMGNAVPRLKAVADQIVASNDENGVAQAIEMFVLGSEEAAR